MYDLTYFVLELIGTVAFSISGSIIGIRKRMDILGVIVLGLSTAVGGGIIRDIILNVTPPKAFTEPVFVITSVVASIIIFIPCVRNFFIKYDKQSNLLLLWMDSIGLGVFTVVGIRAGHVVSDDFSFYFFVFEGLMTGVGGGVMRDVLSKSTPYIFKKHFYGTASIIGGIVCELLWYCTGEAVAMIVGAALVLILRLCAAHYRWKLPVAKHRVDE